MGGKNIALEGIVVRGLGEGSYFMSMKHYKKEIKKKLGFEAYPGTLNIKIKKPTVNIIKKIKSIEIKGYTKQGKEFHGAHCFLAKVKDIKGSIIMPHKNKHSKDIIEFIAPVHLKSELKIKNGDKVKIEIVNQR